MYKYADSDCCYPMPTAHIAGLNRRFAHAGVDYNPGEYKRVFKPRVDIAEDNENFYFSFDMPGFRREDIKVKIDENNVLLIEGNKTVTEMKDDMKRLRSERAFGEFSRTFQLPDTADGEKVTAKFADGVLDVTIAKKEAAKPKTIVINPE